MLLSVEALTLQVGTGEGAADEESGRDGVAAGGTV